MMNRKFSWEIVFLIVLIFLLNFIASKFYWYSSVWFFDMFMHFLGGFWLGMVSLWFLNYGEISLKNVFSVIFFVLLIGLGWEFFEIIINNSFAKDKFDLFDTLSDVCFDLSGGFFSVFYYVFYYVKR